MKEPIERYTLGCVPEVRENIIYWDANTQLEYVKQTIYYVAHKLEKNSLEVPEQDVEVLSKLLLEYLIDRINPTNEKFPASTLEELSYVPSVTLTRLINKVCKVNKNFEAQLRLLGIKQ
jgi:hypothetical protein